MSKIVCYGCSLPFTKTYLISIETTKCGLEQFSYHVPENSHCEEVFICSLGSSGFVQLENLCDGQNTCGHERLCSESRSSELFDTNLVTRVGKTELEHEIEYAMHCLPGVKKV